MKTDMVVKDKESVTKTKKRKPMKMWQKMLIIVLILFLISLSCVILKKNNSSSITLTAHFSAVSEGKNPDGSPFNINEVLSDEVLQSASEKLGGRVDAETLKKHLSISDNVSAENLKNLEKEIVDGNTKYTYFPNMYTLTYSVVSEEIKNEGMVASFNAIKSQFGMPCKEEILNSVSESYKEYYAEKYIKGTVTMDIDWTGIDNLDYYNKAEKIKYEAKKISRFVLEKYNKEPEFISETGIGYGDLYSEIGQILEIDIENYSAFIIQNGLTNNKQALLLQFRYMENLKREDNTRSLLAYDVTKSAIDIYDADTTKVVFIPSLDYDRSFYMNRTKVGMDYLVENANEAKTEADTALHDAEKYSYLENHFSDSEMASPEIYAVADSMYAEIKDKINLFNDKAEIVMSEGSENNDKENIELGEPFSNYDIVSMGVNGIKIFVMLLIVFYLFYVIITDIKKRICSKVPEGEKK